MSNIFIRFDIKGTFRGPDHISQFGDGFDGDEENLRLEPGISCYRLSAWGVQQLIRYWTHQMCQNDFSEFNLTVFAGELIGTGTDFEDCATCTEVIAELDAQEFYKTFLELEERYFETEDEIYEILEKQIREEIAQ